MKRSDLIIGETYSDGKKGLRRIVAFGPEYTLYSGQVETDCLLYAIVSGKRPAYALGTTEAGEHLKHSTAASFAAWAKARHAPPVGGEG